MTRRFLIPMLAGIATALVSACGRTELNGPPTIQLGRDECTDCGMLVAEARCSCALLVEQDGRREHLVFDDLGCLLDYRSHHPRTVIVGTFVHDFATGTWVPGDAAYYLFGISDTRSTPMASGIVAFETERLAREKQSLSGGEIMNHERLVEARRGSREAWRSPATGSP